MSFSLIISVIALVISIINVYRFNKGGKPMTDKKIIASQKHLRSKIDANL